MKKIQISVFALAGIILVILGFTLGVVALYNYKSNECIKNPVDYANNYSDNYWWDSVNAINYGFYG